ncbi:MAG: acyl-CoA thioesterase [Bacteroidetes bacterium]|nr:acyl-CoA thioesterase [Bacteroidota bacterium]
MIPSYANFGGKIHGGILLSLMDKVAYVTASKHYGGYCVTVAVEGVEFMHPVEVGQLVSLKASINYVGKSSMIVGIRVEALQPKTGEVFHTNSSYFTMVAKNDDHQTDRVPGLILQTETEIRRFYEGMHLKHMAKQKREMLKSDFSSLTLEDICAHLLDENCKF